MPAPSVTKPLLLGIVDYAGLFPPAGLGMAAAADNFARYRHHPQGWMLGAFVVPAWRLPELASFAAWSPTHPWPLSVLVGGDGASDAAALREFQAKHGTKARVVALEIKAAEPTQVEPLHTALDAGPQRYFEVPWQQSPEPWLAAIAQVGAAAKLRTGGVTPDLIPPTSAVAGFMVACKEANLAFKATAGLHHPVRAEYALTYEDDAPRAVMHGFLNVFVGAALLAADKVDADGLLAILDEMDPAAFAVDAQQLRWRDHVVAAAEIAHARGAVAHSFGSCSFEEPVTDLQEAGWL